MSPVLTLTTARRVLQMLRHDRRTLVLIIVVPCVLMGLFRWLFDTQDAAFQHIGVPLDGIFPLSSMFLVSSVTMLRERRSGTLERLMTLPIHKADIIGGYALAFGAVAILQSGVVSLVSTVGFGLDLRGNAAAIVGVAVLNAVLGVALGLFVSAFASTEFQAVQFFPAVVIPQLVLCGIIAPRGMMAEPLQWISAVFPLTYAYEGLSTLAQASGAPGEVLRDVVIVLAYCVVALGLGAVTLRRRTA